MCNFFSAVTDFKNLYYFDAEQRKSKVKMPDGTSPSYDSHASICAFYRLNEDAVEKLEYNPYTDKLKFDNPNANRYADLAREKLLSGVDWRALAGDVEGVRSFLAEIRSGSIPLFQPDGTLVENEKIRIFDTRDAASSAAAGAARAAARNARAAVQAAAYNAARAAARDAAYNAAWGAARDAAVDAAWDAGWDFALYAAMIYACADLPIEQKHIDYIKMRTDIWRHGYGVLCDVNGVLYCYKKIQ